MDKLLFDPSTHRLVEYKGKAVAIPLMVYWKLDDMRPDETVIIQELAGALTQKVKVSELSDLKS